MVNPRHLNFKIKHYELIGKTKCTLRCGLYEETWLKWDFSILWVHVKRLVLMGEGHTVHTRKYVTEIERKNKNRDWPPAHSRACTSFLFRDLNVEKQKKKKKNRGPVTLMKRTWPRTWASSFHSSDSSPHLLFWPSMRLVFNSTRSCGSFCHMYIVYFYNFKGSRSTFCRRSSDNRFVTVKPWWWEIFLCAWIKYCKNSNKNSHNANDLFTVFLRRTRGLHRQPNTPQFLLFFFFF